MQKPPVNPDGKVASPSLSAWLVTVCRSVHLLGVDCGSLCAGSRDRSCDRDHDHDFKTSDRAIGPLLSRGLG